MALNINGTTGISGVDGSASAPALQGTDSNTGINFASDTVNINTGGQTRVEVDASGNMGINTTSPSDKLHVSGGDIIISAASAPNLRIVSADDSSGSLTNRVFLGFATGSNNL